MTGPQQHPQPAHPDIAASEHTSCRINAESEDCNSRAAYTCSSTMAGRWSLTLSTPGTILSSTT